MEDTAKTLPSAGAAFTPMNKVAEMAKIWGGMPFIGSLPGSPAEKAGLVWGDIVLAVNGMATPDPDSFVEARKLREGGARVRFVRNGIEREVDLTW
jgi:S1-C subfamily serine protease